MSPVLTQVLEELLPTIITLLGKLIKGNPTEIEQAALAVVQSSATIYQAQVGKPIDPTLITPIQSV